MTPSVTARQRAYLHAIGLHVATHGYAPSLRELGRSLGVTCTAASVMRDKLRHLGFVTSSPGIARTLQLTATGRTASEVSP